MMMIIKGLISAGFLKKHHIFSQHYICMYYFLEKPSEMPPNHHFHSPHIDCNVLTNICATVIAGGPQLDYKYNKFSLKIYFYLITKTL